MHQLQALHGVAREGRKHDGGESIAIVSGQRGVGKTSVAVNLGIHLAKGGTRVILLDAGRGRGNVDKLLNIKSQAHFADVAGSSRRPSNALLGESADIRVVSFATELHGRAGTFPTTAQNCQRAAQRLREQCDWLLVDCPAGLTRTMTAFALACDRVVLVTTPEPTAMADGYAALKYLTGSGFTGRVGIVVNMARSRSTGARAGRRIRRVASRFLGLTWEEWGVIAHDEHVPRAARAGVPVALLWPHGHTSVAIKRICGRLRRGGDHVRSPAVVWRRVAGLFL